MMTIPSGLRVCWHPVAFSHQVTNAPHATKRLNEQLVLWRTEDGALHALSDYCRMPLPYLQPTLPIPQDVPWESTG